MKDKIIAIVSIFIIIGFGAIIIFADKTKYEEITETNKFYVSETRDILNGEVHYVLRNEKIGNAILYVITLVLVMSAILTVNLVSKINVVFEELIANYDVTVPDFELKDSKLDVREVISKALNSKSYLLINT